MGLFLCLALPVTSCDIIRNYFLWSVPETSSCGMSQKLLPVICPKNYCLWSVPETSSGGMSQKLLPVVCPRNFFLWYVPETTSCDLSQKLLPVVCPRNYKFTKHASLLGIMQCAATDTEYWFLLCSFMPLECLTNHSWTLTRTASSKLEKSCQTLKEWAISKCVFVWCLRGIGIKT